MEEALRRLLAMIGNATARVATGYFHLPVADADAVYRERVYCYELYHQLRCVWNHFPFSLGGEVDKIGHPHFQDGPYAAAKPDLLEHVPGDMAQNLAVIEIKTGTVKARGIQDDIQKLNWFCQNAGYSRGIFLLYGDLGEPIDVRARLKEELDPGMSIEALVCLYHRRVGESAWRIQL